MVWLAMLSSAAAAAAQQELVPWFYEDVGDPVWKRHQFWEDNSNTVYALAWEFVKLSEQSYQPDRPDVLLLNAPHFDPPEGVPADPGERKLLFGSLQERALQLHVNYGKARVEPSVADNKYPDPTFFLSLGIENGQTDPAVLDVGLSSVEIAPTRAALGIIGESTEARAPYWHEQEAATFPMNALYVTAGVGFGLGAFDPDPAVQAEIAALCLDRLFRLERDPNDPDYQRWEDVSSLVPLSIRRHNSSGACFADFDGDGDLDLFVGKPGDDYEGARNRIAIYANGSYTDETTTRLPDTSDATVDVACGDLDGDDDIDIVVANRVSRSGQSDDEFVDYVLENDGTGHFTAHPLLPPDPADATDTRTVAIADLDQQDPPEIVLGNSTADFSNELAVTGEHAIQIFRANGNMNFEDKTADYFSSADLTALSRPFTWQIVAADVFAPDLSPQPLMPDGAVDLVLVKHRDILLDQASMKPASEVRFLINSGDTLGTLIVKERMEFAWATTLALANFSENDDPNYGESSPNTLDLFVGAGNSYSGYDSQYRENLGRKAGSWPPWNRSNPMQFHESYDLMPGIELGYGFDFADFDRNGWIDAVQTSRGYNFLVPDLLQSVGHSSWEHWNLTSPSTLEVAFSNRRGQLFPVGAEDAVFADFDADGDLDLLMASQSGTSPTYPAPKPETSDTVLLRNESIDLYTFHHDVQTQDGVTVDAYVDLNGRTGLVPGTADRALAVDLDNDGKDDALVHLFPLGIGTTPLPDLSTVMTPPGLDVEDVSAGWRYLLNQHTGPSHTGEWFLDVTASSMVDGSGTFNQGWNRPLGVDIAADFDNNGACDFFTAHSLISQTVGTDVEDAEQVRDLLFMNGSPMAGVLTESSAALGIPQRMDSLGGNARYAGTAGLAQGDLDHDGDADLFISASGRWFSQLLMNDLNSSGMFGDELDRRVPRPIVTSTSVIHSKLFPGTQEIQDKAGAPILVDLDADGDLDLIHAVEKNAPRIYLNTGTDYNEDGFIDAKDQQESSGTVLVGYFEDATDDLITRVRPIVDSVDAQAVDVDRDGDFDLAFDAFFDEVVFWRNNVAQLAEGEPAVTEAWPRIGAIQGRFVELEGVNLLGAEQVELTARETTGGSTTTTTWSITSIADVTDNGNGRIKFRMPQDQPGVPGPVGLVQIRVLNDGKWSKQYFGYFALDPTL